MLLVYFLFYWYIAEYITIYTCIYYVLFTRTYYLLFIYYVPLEYIGSAVATKESKNNALLPYFFVAEPTPRFLQMVLRIFYSRKNDPIHPLPNSEIFSNFHPEMGKGRFLHPF